jgi:hypothetical protein
MGYTYMDNMGDIKYVINEPVHRALEIRRYRNRKLITKIT